MNISDARLKEIYGDVSAARERFEKLEKNYVNQPTRITFPINTVKQQASEKAF